VSGLPLIALLATVMGTMLVPPLLGYDLYAIDGGSMEPTIHRGAIAYAREVPVAELRRNDVITYVPPGHSRPVTHRVVAVTRPDPRRGPVFQTKGDANRAADARLFHLDRPTQARFEISIPYLGWALLFLGTSMGKVIGLGLPAVLVAVWVVASLWREGGRVLKDGGDDEAAAEYEALGAQEEALVAGVRAGAT